MIGDNIINKFSNTKKSSILKNKIKQIIKKCRDCERNLILMEIKYKKEKNIPISSFLTERLDRLTEVIKLENQINDGINRADSELKE